MSDSPDLLLLLERVARSMESVVPDLELTAGIFDPVWLGENDTNFDTPGEGAGEWVNALGFEIRYRGVWYGGFEHGSSGSTPERVKAVALELMCQVQDTVSEITTEPWPKLADRRDMAFAQARIDGDSLQLWYGDAAAPTLKLPPVALSI